MKIDNFFLKNRLYINFLLLIILFTAHCFASWVAYIVFPILAVMTLADNLENGLSYIMWSLPFCMLSPFVSLIFYLCIIVAYIIKFYLIFFIKDKGKLHWLELLLIALFFLYAVLPIGPYTFNKLFKIVIILIIFSALIGMSKKLSVLRIGFNIKVLAISLVLSCGLGLLWFVSPYLKTIITYPSSTDIRFQGLFSQTNLLGMICAVVLSILAYQIIKNRKGWLDIALFVGVAGCGISTISKNFLILFCVILLSLFIAMMFINWKRTLIFGIVVASVVLVAYFIKPDFFQTYISRFVGNLTAGSSFEQIMNTLTTGRWNLWKGTFSYLGTHPLNLVFGRGLGAPAIEGLSYSAHNAYFSMIDQLGIVGSILFMIPLVFLIKNIFKSQKVSKAIIIPIIVVAMLLMVEDAFFYINAF